MAQGDDAQPTAMPGPDPELKRLDRFVGTWSIKGRTLDSDKDNVTGQATFEWLPGGFFLQQRIDLDFAGFEIQATEIIGYDAESGVYPSTVFSNMVGVPLPYEYDIKGDDVTIRTEFGGGATYKGRFGEDGKSFSGGWRPDKDAPGNIAYDLWGTRLT
jgi:hypothetical protein